MFKPRRVASRLKVLCCCLRVERCIYWAFSLFSIMLSNSSNHLVRYIQLGATEVEFEFQPCDFFGLQLWQTRLGWRSREPTPFQCFCQDPWQLTLVKGRKNKGRDLCEVEIYRIFPDWGKDRVVWASICLSGPDRDSCYFPWGVLTWMILLLYTGTRIICDSEAFYK